MNQTLPFSHVIVINDASTDRTKEIAKDYPVDILIDLQEKHESYVGKPELSKIFNYAFRTIQKYGLKNDYIMQLGGDTLIPLNYNEEMLKRLQEDQRIVIAGGVIKGEKQYTSHVRGSGRYYQSNFWFKHIWRYHFNFTWESYPIYYSQALGFKIKVYTDLIMTSLRPTRTYKDLYGYAMRDLGYFPPYALVRCFLSIMLSRRDGINMLINYLRSPYKSQLPTVKNFIRHHQIRRILHIKESFNIWFSRL